MINIIISVVILLLIILYLSYNKEKFISSTHEEHIEYLKEKIKELNELKKKYNFKNVDGSDSPHTLLDNLIYKRALLDSTKIEKKLNEIYQKIS